MLGAEDERDSSANSPSLMLGADAAPLLLFAVGGAPAESLVTPPSLPPSLLDLLIGVTVGILSALKTAAGARLSVVITVGTTDGALVLSLLPFFFMSVSSLERLRRATAGADEGTTLGASLGTTLGASLGTALGASLGTRLGASLGTTRKSSKNSKISSKNPPGLGGVVGAVMGAEVIAPLSFFFLGALLLAMFCLSGVRISSKNSRTSSKNPPGLGGVVGAVMGAEVIAPFLFFFFVRVSPPFFARWR